MDELVRKAERFLRGPSVEAANEKGGIPQQTAPPSPSPSPRTRKKTAAEIENDRLTAQFGPAALWRGPLHPIILPNAAAARSGS